MIKKTLHAIQNYSKEICQQITNNNEEEVENKEEETQIETDINYYIEALDGRISLKDVTETNLENILLGTIKKEKEKENTPFKDEFLDKWYADKKWLQGKRDDEDIEKLLEELRLPQQNSTTVERILQPNLTETDITKDELDTLEKKYRNYYLLKKIYSKNKSNPTEMDDIYNEHSDQRFLFLLNIEYFLQLNLDNRKDLLDEIKKNNIHLQEEIEKIYPNLFPIYASDFNTLITYTKASIASSTKVTKVTIQDLVNSFDNELFKDGLLKRYTTLFNHLPIKTKNTNTKNTNTKDIAEEIKLYKIDIKDIQLEVKDKELFDILEQLFKESKEKQVEEDSLIFYKKLFEKGLFDYLFDYLKQENKEDKYTEITKDLKVDKDALLIYLKTIEEESNYWDILLKHHISEIEEYAKDKENNKIIKKLQEYKTKNAKEKGTLETLLYIAKGIALEKKEDKEEKITFDILQEAYSYVKVEEKLKNNKLKTFLELLRNNKKSKNDKNGNDYLESALKENKLFTYDDKTTIFINLFKKYKSSSEEKIFSIGANTEPLTLKEDYNVYKEFYLETEDEEYLSKYVKKVDLANVQWTKKDNKFILSLLKFLNKEEKLTELIESLFKAKELNYKGSKDVFLTILLYSNDKKTQDSIIKKTSLDTYLTDIEEFKNKTEDKTLKDQLKKCIKYAKERKIIEEFNKANIRSFALLAKYEAMEEKAQEIRKKHFELATKYVSNIVDDTLKSAIPSLEEPKCEFTDEMLFKAYKAEKLNFAEDVSDIIKPYREPCIELYTEQ